MDKRALGSQGLVVSAEGLGCMGMSEFYGSQDEGEAIATIQHALELGIDLLDTADMYGPHTNERLVGEAIADRRDEVVLATKFGIVRDPDNPSARGVNGRPEYVHASCDASLRRLAVDHIDLYYQHRVDPTCRSRRPSARWPSWSTPARSGSSGCQRRRRRRSAAPTPSIRSRALQTEYSLWSRDPEDEILDTVRELGIGFVAYSPLGRGFLTGQITSPGGLRARRLPPPEPALPGRELRAQPGARRPRPGDRGR